MLIVPHQNLVPSRTLATSLVTILCITPILWLSVLLSKRVLSTGSTTPLRQTYLEVFVTSGPVDGCLLLCQNLNQLFGRLFGTAT